MNSSLRKLPGSRYLAWLVLLCASSGAISAPVFVTDTKITRGNMMAEISLRFACSVQYVDHTPIAQGDSLRIQLESTENCNGASPAIIRSREQLRPLDGDQAKLTEIDYDGESSSGQALLLSFTEAVRFDVVQHGVSNNLAIRVFFDSQNEAMQTRAVQRSAPETETLYVINLSTSREPHTAPEIQAAPPNPDLGVFETDLVLAGVTWYRLRLGPFARFDQAQTELRNVQARYPNAWIDEAKPTESEVSANLPATDATQADAYEVAAPLAELGPDRIDELMSEARLAMVAGEFSRAVQIYTKVLQAPNHDRHAQALEFLAIARERNGQTAHAKAEYQRYLTLYPTSEGAARVEQRLAALLASNRQVAAATQNVAVGMSTSRPSSQSAWRMQSFFSQYYRRDANQFNDEDELVSQSALYSDVNIDVRRQGERFDFASRVSAGYRSDFLDEGDGSGNELRLSYAYADLADAGTGLQGRVGRQTRTSGGVLGRFDGLNLGYRPGDRILVNAVAGKPVYSSSDSADSGRTFYGASVNYGPILDDLELGLYYIQQDIEGIDDRQAVGTEFRYFGENQSLWGLVDYDISYNEIGSAYLQGSWRLAPRFTIHGSIDQRHSPFLSTGNALIGQPFAKFSELAGTMTEDEIRQLSIDRSPRSNTVTFGISHSLTPRLYLNADANLTTIAATPKSGGVPATQETSYQYYAASMTASGLLMEGDAAIVGLRYTDSDTTSSMSLNLDGRIPVGRYLRTSLRLRVDRRQFKSDASYEWLYSPGLRLQYFRSQKFRIELDIGRQISQREWIGTDLDRKSYFINLGYQAFF